MALSSRYVGHRVAGEVWVDPKLESEVARKVERALKSTIAHIKGLYSAEE